ncbi:MAG: arginine--tRNA ligase [Patescibacteria group bacterium]
MYTLEAIKSNIARLISEKVESNVKAEEIVIPPRPEMGDLAFGCFKLAKEKGKNPAEIAKKLATELGKADQNLAAVKAEGPYVNFELKSSLFADRVVQEVEKLGEKYGAQDAGKKKEVMVEYANLNSHKEFHVGHLRNILYGLSIQRMLDVTGWKTIPVSYINDMGAHVAKCLWLFVRNGSTTINPKSKTKSSKSKSKDKKEDPFQEIGDWSNHVLQNLTLDQVKEMIAAIPQAERTGKYLGTIYAEATKLLGENEAWKTEVSLVQKKLEDHDKAWTFLWQETRRWSLGELSQYLQDFGVSMKRQYLESELVDQSKKIVDELLAKGIAIESRGAIIVDLDAYPDPEIQKQKLGVMIIRKSDGSLIYASKDLPLAELKFSEFPKQELSLIVVDVRQSLYFKQLFAVLKLMGYTKPLKHLGYEFITLPEGAISSRKGNAPTLQDFLAKVRETAKQEVINRHTDWNDGKIEHTAWCVAMGGINFAILRQDPEKIIIFDLKKALSFEGDTGPYVQYSVTRLNSILQKAGIKDKLPKADLSLLEELTEKKLALQLAKLPEVNLKAAQDYKPSVIAAWLLDTSSAVNAFYRDVPVLDADAKVRDARLRLISAAKQAMTNALYTLGIPVPDAM